MIAKAKAPTMNRAWRRHGWKRAMQTTLPRGSGMPWLLFGLLQRGGFLPFIGANDMAVGGTPVPLTAVARTPGKSIVGRIAAKLGRWFGR